MGCDFTGALCLLDCTGCMLSGRDGRCWGIGGCLSLSWGGFGALSGWSWRLYGLGSSGILCSLVWLVGSFRFCGFVVRCRRISRGFRVVVEGHVDRDCFLWGWRGVVNSPRPPFVGGVVTGRDLRPLGDNGPFTGNALCVRGDCVVALVSLLAAWYAYGGRGGVTNAGHVLCRTSRFAQVGLAAWQSVRELDSICR